MNHRRLASAAGAALALGIGITAASLAPQANASPAAHVLVDCLGKKQVAPASYVQACADGNAYLSKLHWTAWAPKLAAGRGQEVENDCRPTCVGGHFHSYPVLVALSGSAAYQGSERYTEMTLTFTGARPEIYNGHAWVPGPRVQTFPLWAP
jgi:hypothetical protein